MRVATYTRTAETGWRAANNLALRQRGLHDVVLVMPNAHFTASYYDIGTSRRRHRPGLQQALTDAAARRYDVLVVDGADRLSLDRRRVRALTDHLAKYGVAVYDINPRRTRRRRRVATATLAAIISELA